MNLVRDLMVKLTLDKGSFSNDLSSMTKLNRDFGVATQAVKAPLTQLETTLSKTAQASKTHATAIKSAGDASASAGKQAQSSGTGFKALDGVLSDVKKSALALGPAMLAGGAAIGSAFAVKGAIDAAKDLGGQVNQLKREFGGTAEDASKLAYELQRTVGFDAGEKAVAKLSKSLQGLSDVEDGTIPKGKGAADTLKQLGIHANDAHGQMLPMNALLPQIGEKFKTMPDGAEKTALAIQLFGKSGKDMLPFLNQGAAGMAALAKQADAAGLVLGQKDLDAIKKNSLATKDLADAKRGLQVQIGLALLPVMVMLAQHTATVAAAFNQNLMPVIKVVMGIVSDLAQLIVGKAIAGFDLFHAAVMRVVTAVGSAVLDRLRPAIKFVQDFARDFRELLQRAMSGGLDFSGIDRIYDAVDRVFGGRIAILVINFVDVLTTTIGTISRLFKTGFNTDVLYDLQGALEGVFGTGIANKVTLAISTIILGVKGLVDIFREGPAALIPFAVALESLVGPRVAGLIMAGVNGIAAGIDLVRGALATAAPFFAIFGGVLGTLVTVIGVVAAGSAAWGLAMAALAPVLGILAPVLGVVGTALAFIVSPIGLIVIGLAALVAAIVLTVQHWDEITAKFPILNTILDGVRAGVEAFVAFLPSAWETAISALSTGWDAVSSGATTAFGLIQDAVSGVVGFIRDNWGGISSVAQSVWEGVRSVVSDTIAGILSVVGSVIDTVRDHWSQIQSVAESAFGGAREIVVAVVGEIVQIVQQVAASVEEYWPQVKQAAERIWEAVKIVIEGAMLTIGAVVVAGILVLRQAWETFGPTIISVVQIAWDTVKTIIDGALKVIGGILKVAISLINGDWSAAWDGVKLIVSGAWEIIKGLVQGGVNAAVAIIKGIGGMLGDLSSTLVSAGVQLMKGLASGIVSGAEDAVKGALHAVTSKIPDWKPIATDDQLLQPAGELISYGLGIGLRNGYRMHVQPVLADVTTSISDTFASHIPPALAASTEAFNFWANAISDTNKNDNLKKLNEDLRLWTAHLIEQRQLLANVAPYSAQAAAIQTSIKIHEAQIAKIKDLITIEKDERQSVIDATTALDGFNDAWHNIQEQADATAKLGAGGAGLFQTLLFGANDAKTGQQAAQQLSSLIDTARKAGVEGIDQLGADLHSSLLTALAHLDDPAMIQPFLDNLALLQQRSEATTKATADNLLRNLDISTRLTTLTTRFSASGAALFGAFDDAARTGAAVSLTTVTNATQGILKTLDTLPAEMSGPLRDKMIAATKAYLDDPTEAGRAALESVVNDIAVQAALIPKSFADLPPLVQGDIQSLVIAVESGELPLQDAIDRQRALVSLIPKDFEKLPQYARDAILGIAQQVESGSLPIKTAVERQAEIVGIIPKTFRGLPPIVRDSIQSMVSEIAAGTAPAGFAVDDWNALLKTIPDNLADYGGSIAATIAGIVKDIQDGVLSIADGITRVTEAVTTAKKQFEDAKKAAGPATVTGGPAPSSSNQYSNNGSGANIDSRFRVNQTTNTAGIRGLTRFTGTWDGQEIFTNFANSDQATVRYFEQAGVAVDHMLDALNELPAANQAAWIAATNDSIRAIKAVQDAADTAAGHVVNLGPNGPGVPAAPSSTLYRSVNPVNGGGGVNPAAALGMLALADGGLSLPGGAYITKGPMTALIGEDGKEAVIPLTKPKQAGEIIDYLIEHGLIALGSFGTAQFPGNQGGARAAFANGAVPKARFAAGAVMERGGRRSDSADPQTVYTGDIHVTIPAKDLKEMGDVRDFFATIDQKARAAGPTRGRSS